MVEKKYYVLAFSIVLSLISLSTLVLTVIGYNSLLMDSIFLTNIQNNHRRSIYSSVSDSKTCQNIEDKVFNYNFEGTEHGCFCNSSNIFKGECSSSDLKKGCYNVPKVDSKYLDVWRKTRDLCLIKDEIPDQKLQESNNDISMDLNTNVSNYEFYLKNYAVKQYEDCPSKYKSCGYLDTLKNKLCYPKEKQCPLNDLIVDNQNTFKKAGYNKINLMSSDDLKLFFTNNNNKEGNIIVEMKATEGKMCLDPNYYEGGTVLYQLESNMKNKVIVCPEIGSSRYKYYSFYKLVDTDNKHEIYDGNGVLNSLQQLPDFPKSKLLSRNINLYSINYIGWQIYCLGRFDYPSYLNYCSEVFISNSNIFFSTMLISIFTFILSPVTALGMMEKGKKYMYFIIFVIFSLIMAMAILMSILESTDAPIQKILYCLDSEMKDLYNYYRKIPISNDWISYYLIIENYFLAGILILTCVLASCYTEGYSGYSGSSGYSDSYYVGGGGGGVGDGFISQSNDAVDTFNNNYVKFELVVSSNDAVETNSNGFISSSNDAVDTYQN